jgi:hypothetical protein
MNILYLCNSAHCIARLLGKNPKTILLPSRGPSGIKLKNPNIKLYKIKKYKNTENTSPMGKILKIKANSTANNKFDTGPAKDIKAASLFGFFRLKGLKGTGLPHPNPINTRSNVPIGSKWAFGFRVKRPMSLAVLSPSLSATNACENSCIDMDITRAKDNKIKIWGSVKSKLSIFSRLYISFAKPTNVVVENKK